jgi:UDP-glucose-4-epimerase GalE
MTGSRLKLLITGGAGYVGSHCVRALLAAGHDVVVLDNLSTGHRAAVPRSARLVVGDLEDAALVDEVLDGGRFDGVLHFAADIEVGESVINPLKFYNNNSGNSFRLLAAMQRHGVRRLVFSSTCAIYGIPEKMPITEDSPQKPESPYARAKLAVEWAIRDSVRAWNLGCVALRYFNAAGASADATIGEDHDPETHLIPNVLMAPLGQAPCVRLYGTDYDTPDGTCIRDYIHVEDLAAAHQAAQGAARPGACLAYNAGTGRGASVREVIEVAEAVTGNKIAVDEQPRREGDVPVLCADSSKIQRELKWTPRFTNLHDIIASAWAWHRSHPNGYGDRIRKTPR